MAHEDNEHITPIPANPTNEPNDCELLQNKKDCFYYCHSMRQTKLYKKNCVRVIDEKKGLRD
jgi:hypothetical protein